MSPLNGHHPQVKVEMLKLRWSLSSQTSTLVATQLLVMAPSRVRRTVTSSSSNRPVSAIKRGLSQPAVSQAKKARNNCGSKPSTSFSHQISSRRTPAGTPVPIGPRHDNARTEASEEDSELYDHVILAVDQVKKTLGCSYYVAGDGRLFCMEDIEIDSKDAFDIR